MLVLSRFEGEAIIIGNNVMIKVLGVSGSKVRLGIKAPKVITVNRQEIHERILRQRSSKNYGQQDRVLQGEQHA